jgi:hypothetical protein
MKKIILVATLFSVAFTSKAATTFTHEQETKPSTYLYSDSNSIIANKPLTYLQYEICGYACAPGFSIVIDDSDMASSMALIDYYVSQQLAAVEGC